MDLVSFLPPGSQWSELSNENSIPLKTSSSAPARPIQGDFLSSDLFTRLNHIEVVRRDPFWRDPALRFKSYLSITPRDVIQNYSQEMELLIQKMALQGVQSPGPIKREEYNIVIASILNTAPYAIQMQHIPKLLEEHNFTSRWMEDRFRSERKTIRKILNWFTWQKCLRYERQLYPKFQAISMVSKKDQLSIQQSIPNYSGRVMVIPNGVDLETRRPGLTEPQPDTLVFNGSLTYAPNLEGIRFFHSKVLPIIRQKRPGVKLTITGRIDEKVDLSWIANDPHIEITGYLEEVSPVVAASWVCIAPIQDGGGSRLKILEAMALGTPVVSTTKGAEGLEVIHGKHLLLADNPELFSKYCLDLLEQQQLRDELTRNARNVVEEKYDWRTISESFCRLVEEIALNKGKTA